MQDLENSPPLRTRRTGRLRPIARWMLTFVGFPLGGFAALLLIGPVNGPWKALLGGAITGLFIGAAQAWGLGARLGGAVSPWIAGTTVGMTIGLAIGAAAVGYSTSLSALTIQGAICGLAVGVAQALVLPPRTGWLRFVWPPALAAIWAISWTVTTLGGIRVDEQFTVFGSFGAITATALTLGLPLFLARTPSAA